MRKPMKINPAQQLSLFADVPQIGEYPVPPGATSAACLSCGRAIYWITTPAGRAMPVLASSARQLDGQRFAMSHFVDCPEGREWAGKK